MKVLAIVLLVASVAYGLPQGYDYQPPQPPPPPPQQSYLAPEPSNRVVDVVMEGMPYDFTWGVEDDESGNAFSHVENSDGQTTQGEYRVLLPDGRTQVVTFYDNGDGFNADVKYE
ncbi:Structural constituent of cuticle [Halocaridina rubra]|uniref:Structural constituent of cuticle n=1 Tax=Halocaridina rubra TaxID=373956 RepID=A0AAN8WRE8_HALRR